MPYRILLITVLLPLLACSPGPQGPQGPAGPPGPSGTTPAGYFDVGAFGAKADFPSFDSTASFQSALNAARDAGGGIVWVPHGRFWFSGSLSIGPNVALVGAGIGPYDPGADPSATSVAPTLLPTSTSGSAFISIKGENSALENVLIYYPDQVRPNAPGVDTAGPLVYPPTVLVLGPSKIFGCSFLNSYIGIEVGVGRVYLENLHIGGLKNDIIIDNARDFVHISHVTASVFWETPLAIPIPSPLDIWVKNNGVALTSYRMDSLEIDDFGVFWRNTGITFHDSPRGFGSTYGRGSNIDIDNVRYGLVAESANDNVEFLFTNLFIGAQGGVNAIWLPPGQQSVYIGVEGGAVDGKAWTQPLRVEAGILSVRNIVGLNPIGLLPALGLVAPALPPSGIPYVSRMPADAQVSISGGSVQGILIGGQSTGLTSGMFNVAPSQSISVMYTSAPAWSWFLE